MKIKTKLFFSAFIVVVLSIAIGMVLRITTQQVNRTTENTQELQKIVTEVFDLNTLLNDYLLHHEERAESQWQLKHKAIDRSLASQHYTNPEDQKIYRKVLEAQKSTGTIFPKLTQAYKNNESDELQDRLTSQLLIKSQTMVSESERLSNGSFAETERIRQNARILIIILLGILAISLALIFFFLYRSIIGPITKLHKGSLAVAAEDWNYKVDIKSGDEMGELAEAFNKMTVKINSYITQQKQMEQQKDDFIASASHELKTPVTSIKIYTQAMQKEFQQAGDMQSVELFKKIVGQLNKLSNLINDLLDANKAQEGRLQYKMGFFELNPLVNEIIQEIQPITESHPILQKLMKSKPVYGDRDRIGQVLINLLSNAIKYSPNKEQIIVRTLIQGSDIIVSVQDFGIGIAKKDQEKIFERFYRASGDVQKTYPGIGLGLFISNQIIKRHAGKMWVKSQPGKNTTFFFSLPIAKDRSEPASGKG